MKKLVAIALLMAAPIESHAWDQRPNRPINECAKDLPFGVPIVSTPNTTLECHEGYALQHDNSAKIPVWVGWTITPEETVGCVARTDSFAADLILPKGQRSEVSDYVRSGYDKGHLAPDGDMSYDALVERESFLMSNMSPQLPSLNRGAWKQLESQTREWALLRNHNLTVYSGNVYTLGKSKTIGENRVVVPDALYKIIIDDVTGEVLAFYFPQEESKSIDSSLRVTTVAEIERYTGVYFPVPAGYNKNSVTFIIWPRSPLNIIGAKRSTCKSKI
jgi:endonuclease G